MKKKWTGMLALMLVFMLSLSGCSSPAIEKTKTTTENQSLEVWTFYDGNVPGYYYLFQWDELEKEYQCTLDVKNYTLAEMNVKLSTAVATGELPDIFYIEDDSNMEMLAKAKVCLPLQTYLSNVDYQEGYLSEYSGNIYVVPCVAKKYLVTYYNTELLEKMDLQIPTSYEELLEMLDKIQDYNEAHDTDYVLMEYGDKDGESSENLLNVLVHQIDENAWQQYDQGSQSDLAALEEGARRLKKLQEKGAFNKNASEKGQSEAITDFIGNEAVMMVESSDIAYHLLQNMGVNGYELTSFLGSDLLLCQNRKQMPGLCVNRASKNADLAAKISISYAQEVNELNVTEEGYFNLLATDLTPSENTPRQIQDLKELVSKGEAVVGNIPTDQKENWQRNIRKYLSEEIDLGEFTKQANQMLQKK